MSRQKKEPPSWNPEYGFCKGLANHPWNRKTMVLTRQGDFLVCYLQCTHCKAVRTSMIHRGSGNYRKKPFYKYPPGYVQHRKGGGRVPKSELRAEYLNFVLKRER